MKFRTTSLYALLVVFVTVGLSACSQEKQDPSGQISVIMFKNPGCQCCEKWASYLKENGFSVSIEAPENMPAVKRQNGVPYTLESCHTALIGDYVVEGHVPQEDIRKLLKEQPEARGIAVPGMPVGSPGMEVPGTQPDSYDVYLFGGDGGPTVFSSH